MPYTDGKYTNPGWTNGSSPDLDADNMNDISNALQDVTAGGSSGCGGGASGNTLLLGSWFPYILPQTNMEIEPKTTDGFVAGYWKISGLTNGGSVKKNNDGTITVTGNTTRWVELNQQASSVFRYNNAGNTPQDIFITVVLRGPAGKSVRLEVTSSGLFFYDHVCSGDWEIVKHKFTKNPNQVAFRTFGIRIVNYEEPISVDICGYWADYEEIERARISNEGLPVLCGNEIYPAVQLAGVETFRKVFNAEENEAIFVGIAENNTTISAYTYNPLIRSTRNTSATVVIGGSIMYGETEVELTGQYTRGTLLRLTFTAKDGATLDVTAGQVVILTAGIGGVTVDVAS